MSMLASRGGGGQDPGDFPPRYHSELRVDAQSRRSKIGNNKNGALGTLKCAECRRKKQKVRRQMNTLTGSVIIMRMTQTHLVYIAQTTPSLVGKRNMPRRGTSRFQPRYANALIPSYITLLVHNLAIYLHPQA